MNECTEFHIWILCHVLGLMGLKPNAICIGLEYPSIADINDHCGLFSMLGFEFASIILIVRARI